MAEVTDLTTETDRVEETLDGAEVIGPYRKQLLEYRPTTQEEEEFITLDTRQNDWSDIALGLYEQIARETPSEELYEGGGIAGACIDAAGNIGALVSTDPGTGEQSIVQSGTTVKSVSTPTTTTTTPTTTSGGGTVPNVQATSPAPGNLTELQKEIINQAVDWLQMKPPGQKWENDNVAIDGALQKLRQTFPDKSGLKPLFWCALFTTVCVNEACKVVGAKNTCPITLGAAAAVAGKNPPTDTNPEPGDVFWKCCGGKTGHVGIVVSVSSNGSILTIEGNSSDAVSMRRYKSNAGMKFKHAGRMPSTGKARAVNGYGKLEGLAAAGYLRGGKWKTL